MPSGQKYEAAMTAANIRGALPRVEDRLTVEAVIWRLDNGLKWRSLPAEFGGWHHAYLRFHRWAIRGVWDKIMAHLVAEGGPQLAFACGRRDDCSRAPEGVQRPNRQSPQLSL